MKNYNEVHPLTDESLINDLKFEQLAGLDLMEIERDFTSIYIEQDNDVDTACMRCYFQSKKPHDNTVILVSIQCSEYGLVIYKAEVPAHMLNKDALLND